MSKVADIAQLFDATFERFGRLDVLVNNAGVMFTKPVAEVGKEEFDRLFAVNVKGTFFCCQQAAKRMADGGRIVNFSASTTALMLPRYAAYVATKGPSSSCRTCWPRNSDRRASRSTWCRRGRPTPNYSARVRPRNRSKCLPRRRFGRLGTPEDIAAAVAMLIGPDAGWVTGQNVRVNGGLI